MSKYRGTVDGIRMAGATAMGGIGKVQMSRVTDLDTDETPEGGDELELFLWFDLAREELLDSPTLLRRSLWVSLAEKAFEGRDRFDLVLGTSSDSDQLVTEVMLIEQRAEYPL